MAYDNSEGLDLGTLDIHKLFRSIFLPTLLGMVFDVAFILTDGIFVGHGVGPDGLASVNLVAPVMMVITGMGIMFGIGSSVVAAIHLARRNVKVARINITQGMLASLVLSLLFSAVLYAFPDAILRLLGTSPHLLGMTHEYLFWFVPTCLLLMLQIVGSFVIRLDGAPRYAMYCAIVSSLLNMLFDYLFIFPFHMGLKGAALATDLGTGVGTLMILWYFMGPTVKLRFYPIIISTSSVQYFLRNVCYMSKVGFSGLLGELALSVMVLCGNLAFGRYIGDEGITAYSVICYLCPVVYNIFYAVSTSAQPILSFNYGAQNTARVNATFRYSIHISVLFAAAATVVMWLFPTQIVSVFLSHGSESFLLTTSGLPLFALGFALVGFNTSAIGYFQSVEKNFQSTFLMSLRGVLLPIVCFLLFPVLLGTKGLWLAIPAAELITLLFALVFLRRTPLHSRNTTPQ